MKQKILKLLGIATLFIITPIIFAGILAVGEDQEKQFANFIALVRVWLPISALCASVYLIVGITKLRQSKHSATQVSTNYFNIPQTSKRIMIALIVLVNLIIFNLPEIGLPIILSRWQTIILSSILSMLVIVIFMLRWRN
jgi:hypothetical protein